MTLREKIQVAVIGTAFFSGWMWLVWGTAQDNARRKMTEEREEEFQNSLVTTNLGVQIKTPSVVYVMTNDMLNFGHAAIIRVTDEEWEKMKALFPEAYVTNKIVTFRR